MSEARKDGRTHLAHKAEHAVDLETGAIVGVTAQDTDDGDTTTHLVLRVRHVHSCGGILRRQLANQRPSGIAELARDFGVPRNGLGDVTVPLDDGGGEIPVRHHAQIVRMRTIHSNLTGNGFRFAQEHPPKDRGRFGSRTMQGVSWVRHGCGSSNSSARTASAHFCRQTRATGRQRDIQAWASAE